jgi:hypothetical protein
LGGDDGGGAAIWDEAAEPESPNVGINPLETKKKIMPNHLTLVGSRWINFWKSSLFMPVIKAE